jgi:hypothetical protein
LPSLASGKVHETASSSLYMSLDINEEEKVNKLTGEGLVSGTQKRLENKRLTQFTDVVVNKATTPTVASMRGAGQSFDFGPEAIANKDKNFPMKKL